VPSAIRNGSLAGTPRFLGSPSHTFAPLYDSGRFGRPHQYDPHDAVPAIPTTRTPAMLISELNHAALVSAAYASSRALPHAHARLVSGWWLAFAGRGSNPLDSNDRFPSATSDLLLSQIYPGATESKARASSICCSASTDPSRPAPRKTRTSTRSIPDSRTRQDGPYQPLTSSLGCLPEFFARYYRRSRLVCTAFRRSSFVRCSQVTPSC
jgi:hypothetical protein